MNESSAGKAKSKWKLDVIHDLKINRGVYILFIPIFVYFVVFNYLPMFGLVMAFQNFNPIHGFLGSEFVGVSHFIDFFSGPTFLLILRNTMVISLLNLFVGMFMSISFALLLNEIYLTKFKRTVQTISYMPHFVSAVVISGLVMQFVSSGGFITNILVTVFGMERQNLLLNPAFFRWINLGTDIWQGMGFGSIIFIAAIAGANQELHEAAAIDGANRLKRCWHITLPAIKATIVVLLVLRLGTLLNVGFERILLLYNPTIFPTADVISTHVMRMGIERMQFGYSAAVGFFNSVFGTILLLGSNFISRKLTDTSLF